MTAHEPPAERPAAVTRAEIRAQRAAAQLAVHTHTRDVAGRTAAVGDFVDALEDTDPYVAVAAMAWAWGRLPIAPDDTPTALLDFLAVTSGAVDDR